MPKIKSLKIRKAIVISKSLISIYLKNTFIYADAAIHNLNSTPIDLFAIRLDDIKNSLDNEIIKRQSERKYDETIVLDNIYNQIKQTLSTLNTKFIEDYQKLISRCETQKSFYRKLEDKQSKVRNFTKAKEMKKRYDSINSKLEGLVKLISTKIKFTDKVDQLTITESILNSNDSQSLSSLLCSAELPVDLINNISSSWCPNVKKIIGRKRNISSILGSSNENVDALEYYDFSDYDLEGSDLSGLNLSEVKLTGTNLVKTNFKNAKLSEVEFNNLTNMIEVDFSNVDFSGRDFSGLKFIKCNFNSANLSFVKFIGCDLSGSSFVNANIHSINLTNAILINTDFSNVVFSSFDFSDYNLSGVKFIGCNLSNADLSQCQLNNTNFSNSILVNTNFGKQDMIECDFSNTDLSSFDFSNRNLSKSKFVGTNLMNANLSFCDLTSVDFSSANLIKANLENKNYLNAKFDKANFAKVKIEKISSFVHCEGISRVICKDKVIIFGDMKGSLYCLNYDENKVKDKFTKKWEKPRVHDKKITSLIFSSDGLFVLSCSDNCYGTILIYELEKGNLIKKCNEQSDKVCGLISLSSSSFVSYSSYNIKIWDISSSTEIYKFDRPKKIYAMTANSNKSIIVTGEFFGVIKLWSIKDEIKDLTFGLLKSRIKTPYVIIDYFKDFFTAMKLEKTYGMNLIKEVELFYRSIDILSLCYSSNDELFAVGFENGVISLYDSRTINYKLLKNIDTSLIQVNVITFSSNNLNILSCSADNIIKIWSVRNGECIGTSNIHRSIVESVAYCSSTNNSIISAGQDKSFVISNLIWE